MGFDLKGKSGATFRNNIWWWHGLMDYVESVWPDIADLMPARHYNGQSGLDEAQSRRLAERLRAEVDSGRCAEYAASFRSPEYEFGFQERFSIEIPKTLIAGYLNTHPNSPERKLRLEKAVEEIKQGQ